MYLTSPKSLDNSDGGMLGHAHVAPKPLDEFFTGPIRKKCFGYSSYLLKPTPNKII